MKDNQGNPLRTVWVIGAGFSYSLGGPLLPDLFRQEDLSDLEAQYSSTMYADLADSCWRTQGLFNWGKKVERRWIDAEQFIDFVDCAGKQSPEAASLLRMSRSARLLDANSTAIRDHADMSFDNLDSIQSGVVRTLAAECSWFTRGALVKTERWAPYRSWLSSLDGAFHTVVSFNYDDVLERLAENSNASVVLPNERISDAARLRILKLHGSVTWLREEKRCSKTSTSAVLACDGRSIAVGIPGQTKRVMKDELFEPLWAQAERAIRNAEVVLLVGYRFPQTDGDALRRILEAIMTNSSNRLRIQLVLGPNVEAPDALRVRKLIEICTRQRQPLTYAGSGPSIDFSAEPLFAEDFLALYGNDGPLSRR